MVYHLSIWEYRNGCICKLPFWKLMIAGGPLLLVSGLAGPKGRKGQRQQGRSPIDIFLFPNRSALAPNPRKGPFLFALCYKGQPAKLESLFSGMSMTLVDRQHELGRAPRQRARQYGSAVETQLDSFYGAKALTVRRHRK